MPKVLYAHNFLDPRQRSFEARIGFDRANELREFLERNNAPNVDGYHVAISYQPRRGYDGKPVYQADVLISKPLLPQELPNLVVKEGRLEDGYASGISVKQTNRVASETLSWEQRERFRKETRDILQQLGVTDLGCWK